MATTSETSRSSADLVHRHQPDSLPTEALVLSERFFSQQQPTRAA
ncbi:hypothetical protein ACF053_00045 [Streptomyces kanasensis]